MRSACQANRAFRLRLAKTNVQSPKLQTAKLALVPSRAVVDAPLTVSEGSD